MGNFYTSITLRTINQQGIIEFLNSLERSAYILPPIKGYTIVYEVKCQEQDTNIISSLTAQLSRQFECVAFVVLNHDDDLLWYHLYSDGNLLDAYNSAPNYFDANPSSEPSGGNANKLCEVFQKPHSLKKVERILRGTDYTFACERHKDLTKALGLPWEYAQISYTDLRDEDKAADHHSPFVKVVARKWLSQFRDRGEAIRPFDLTQELRKLLRQNKKISAITLYQRYKGGTLEQARRYIETL